MYLIFLHLTLNLVLIFYEHIIIISLEQILRRLFYLFAFHDQHLPY